VLSLSPTISVRASAVLRPSLSIELLGSSNPYAPPLSPPLALQAAMAASLAWLIYTLTGTPVAVVRHAERCPRVWSRRAI
jgi:hypothetical protein